ncbi:MAG: ATP-binding protein [Acidilobus sp.]
MSFSRSTSGGQQSLISSLFGKQIEELTCQEALEKLRDISETQYIEFKGDFKDDKGDRDKEVLRAVVGFLNTQDGEGLLALGVNDPSREGERVVCTEWPSKKDASEVEQHIRDIIVKHVGSIPRAIFPPLLTVKVFNCRRDCGLEKDGWLILIYVKKSFDALYYSDLEGGTCAYIRKGASTRRLTIEEAYTAIESKRKPIVIALLEPSKVGSTNAKFSILLKNIGSKPAIQIATMIYIYKKQTIDDQPIEITSVNVKGLDGHYSLYTNKERDRFEVTFFNTHSLGLRTPNLPLFPGPGVKVEEVLETSFSDGFPVFARSGPRKLYFRLYVYTEETKTLEDLEVIMKEREGSKDELNLEGVLKHLKVRDYFGNDLLVRDNLDIKSEEFQRLWSPEIDP